MTPSVPWPFMGTYELESLKSVTRAAKKQTGRGSSDSLISANDSIWASRMSDVAGGKVSAAGGSFWVGLVL